MTLTITASRPSFAQDTIDLTEMLDVVVECIDGRTVAWVRGEIDIATAPRLRSSLMEAVASSDRDVMPGPFTVDVSGVSFFDASGLHVLVDVASSARRAGRKLILRNPTAPMWRVLEITRLLDVFTIEARARVTVPSSSNQKGA
jgi:anti-anti-sigma factor